MTQSTSREIDLSELAIDRVGNGEPTIQPHRNVLSRYVLPTILIVGFLSLAAWASRDVVFPPRSVSVVPVFSTNATVQVEGVRLFQAAGWIEP